MMLSLPLPQSGSSTGRATSRPANGSTQRQFERRSLYFNLILVSAASIRSCTGSVASSSNGSGGGGSSSSSSTNEIDEGMRTNSRFYITETSLDTIDGQLPSPPLHVKLGVNLHLSCDQSNQRELISASNETSASTVLNPTYSDLRHYVESACKLSSKTGQSLVFVDLIQPEAFLSDGDSLKETHAHKGDVFVLESLTASSASSTNPVSNASQQHSQPLISLVAVNVYPSRAGRLVSHGLPFSALINRDCSYAELCRKLLESQTKYLKDRNMLKYRELAHKLFSLSLVDPNTKKPVRLNASDELPLYAECVDKALNESARLASLDTDSNSAPHEYIRLNIEWRSHDDLNGIFRELDSTRAEFVHRTFNQLQRVDEHESPNTVFTYETGVRTLLFISLNQIPFIVTVKNKPLKRTYQNLTT